MPSSYLADYEDDLRYRSENDDALKQLVPAWMKGEKHAMCELHGNKFRCDFMTGRIALQQQKSSRVNLLFSNTVKTELIRPLQVAIHLVSQLELLRRLNNEKLDGTPHQELSKILKTVEPATQQIQLVVSQALALDSLKKWSDSFHDVTSFNDVNEVLSQKISSQPGAR